MPSELIDQLKKHLPPNLAAYIINSFLQIKSDVTTQTLERSAPGKFVETVVQILQFLDTGQFDEKPKVDEYLKNLESRSTNLPDDLRTTLARVARASYTLRSKRNIAHKGGVDPNIYDLRYLYAGAQWILSELIRQILSTDMADAGKLIEFIQIPISSVVEDIGDANSSATLLSHAHPTVPNSQGYEQASLLNDFKCYHFSIYEKIH